MNTTDEGGARHAARETFHLPRQLVEALEEYVRSSRPPTSKSAVMRLALEEYLRREAAWPADQTGMTYWSAECRICWTVFSAAFMGFCSWAFTSERMVLLPSAGTAPSPRSATSPLRGFDLW
jgi:hypothetical protein